LNNRVDKLKDYIYKKDLDGVLIQNPFNRRYLSGFTGSFGFVVITKDKNIFVTDFRYIEQASNQCIDYDIVKHTDNNTIYDIINKLEIKRLGFEEEFITYQQYKELNNRLNSIQLVELEGIINKHRRIKSEDEIIQIRRAAEIADKTFAHICEILKPGVSEEEISLEIEYFMKKQGASGTSFDSIVASGIRSSLPHGRATDKIIEEGDFVTLDFGCIYNGYCSDMTRTIVIGKASEKQREIYDIVLKAQTEALKYIKPGIMGFEVDKVARNIIKEKGYGDYFGHGLGHGVGMEVHEEPRLSPLGKDPLESSMVVTDEPGIYIPDFGGVRIEDLVVVTEDGCEILSKSPKELIEL